MATLLAWLAFVSMRPRTVHDPLGAAFQLLRDRLERAGVAASVSCGPRELYVRSKRALVDDDVRPARKPAVALRADALRARLGRVRPGPTSAHCGARSAPSSHARTRCDDDRRRAALLALLALAACMPRACDAPPYLARAEVQQFIDELVGATASSGRRLERWLQRSALLGQRRAPDAAADSVRPAQLARIPRPLYRAERASQAGVAFWRAQRDGAGAGRSSSSACRPRSSSRSSASRPTSGASPATSARSMSSRR